jgi:hypothetical protein
MPIHSVLSCGLALSALPFKLIELPLLFTLAKDDIQSDGEDDSDDSDTERGNDVEGSAGSEYTTTRSGKRRIGIAGSHDGSSNKHNVKNAVDVAEEQRKKAKLDALWVEMNAPAAKSGSRAELLSTAAAIASSSTFSSSGSNEGGSGKMVTITTSYDFAGETVTVTKDVPENSKEARDYFRKNNKDGNGSIGSGPTIKDTSEATTKTLEGKSIVPNDSTNPLTSSPSILSKPASDPKGATTSSSSTLIDSPSKKPPVRYVRRKSTLDSLAATYGVKKPAKMNTLEKSKLDWNTFVGKEGIEDELKHHNKDGYMEKVAFLQRTDDRRDQEYQLLKKKK